MTYNITLTANHQSLTAEYLPLAAESVQYLTAKVVCETEDWTGREIKAMFGQGCTVYEVPVTGGEITAKQQLNLTAGDWRVWLVGNSARDGDVIPRITTNVAHISVAPTGGTEGNPFPATPPTVEEQLRADMGDLADLTTEDKSSLVAAINEVRQTGGGGVQPDWNQNDSTQPDYIKNRPFYSEKEIVDVSWDGDKTNKVSTIDTYYKVSDLMPTADEFVVYLKTGETETSDTLNGSDIHINYTGFRLVHDYAVICYDASQLLMGRISFPETGIYFAHLGDKYTSRLVYETEIVHTIDPKYIAHTDELIMNSSTADSTKKFKITVDDSGTITATEVT